MSSSSFPLYVHLPNPTPLCGCSASSSRAIQVPLFTFNFQSSHVCKYKCNPRNGSKSRVFAPGRKICYPSRCLQQGKNGEIISSYLDNNDTDKNAGNGSNPSSSFLSFLCPLLKLFSVSISSSESPLTKNFCDWSSEFLWALLLLLLFFIIIFS